jgi:hypothetical protein
VAVPLRVVGCAADAGLGASVSPAQPAAAAKVAAAAGGHPAVAALVASGAWQHGSSSGGGGSGGSGLVASGSVGSGAVMDPTRVVVSAHAAHAQARTHARTHMCLPDAGCSLGF